MLDNRPQYIKDAKPGKYIIMSGVLFCLIEIAEDGRVYQLRLDTQERGEEWENDGWMDDAATSVLLQLTPDILDLFLTTGALGWK